MTLPKAVLLAVTSYNGKFYEDGTNTGAFFSEVYHPWKYFVEHGFKVTLVSETGTFGWDGHSIDPVSGFITIDEKNALDDKGGDFAKTVDGIKKAADVNPADYGIFYAAGGHGTIFDFDGKAPNLADDAGKIWDNGGIVAAVCHGPVILGFVKDKNGKLIAEGKKVTGFSDLGEVEMKLAEFLKKNGFKTVEDVVKPVTDKYVEPNPPFGIEVVVDGRLATGANPASAEPLAEEAARLYSSL